MKRVGVVGGLSPESTSLYYKVMINEYRIIKKDDNYPEIVVYSLSFGRFTQFMREGRKGEALNYLEKALKSLEAAGCDFALISANTPHMFYDDLSKKVNIPLLNIIDVLAEALKKDGVKTVGVLGTYTTMTSGFYIERLERHGVKAIVPEGKDAEVVNDIIMNELTKGILNESSTHLIEGIVEKLKARGAEAISLSCTELPLLIKESIAGLKTYDTAKLHAKRAVRIALGLEDFPPPPE